MNSCSIQDLQIFGDPSRIPIIIIERVVNALLHSNSGNSKFWNMDSKDTHGNQQNGRALKIAVFVHGFLVCHRLEY